MQLVCDRVEGVHVSEGQEAHTLAVRTCPLCFKRIADECPNSLEHVLAQRDHYWESTQRSDRLVRRLMEEAHGEKRSERYDRVR